MRTQESLLFGPYNTILSYLFSASEDFVVVPQYQRPMVGQSIDFTTLSNRPRPIFYLKIKPPRHIKWAEQHTDVGRVRELITGLQIPKLHGISAYGLHYDATAHVLEPAAIPL